MGTSFLIFAIIGFLAAALTFLLTFFDPALEYRMPDCPEVPADSQEFAHLLAVISDAHLYDDTVFEVLTNGDQFYEAELEAIRAARSHISLEAYIFQKGEIADRFIAALTERARAGVEVRLVLDAVGSLNTWRSTFRELIEAGGDVRWYTPLRWYNLARFNNRTHREIVIADGIAFIGGAGVADHWYKDRGRNRRWRDTMVRIQGRAVDSLQAIFAENWLESSGELLSSCRYYPAEAAQGTGRAMVIDSTPSFGRSTRARMLYQVLIATARQRVQITTPYFLPDAGMRRVLIEALQRGVEVQILVPGKHSDHLLTRRSSRRLYGSLLQNGAQIYEYQPSMIHTKSAVIDGLWSVVGSSNFDSRSFGINDEVNVAACDPLLTERLEADFAADLKQSQRITYQAWRNRPSLERAHELLGWLLERQE
ncbi:MAG: phospholipase D-like domain-containing protein [Candidatus Solibacter sp.]